MILSRWAKLSLGVQALVSFLCFPWFVPLFILIMRVLGGYRCDYLFQIRSRVRNLLKSSPQDPLVICSNHLTMIDSMLISWFIFSPWNLITSFRCLPWNVPEFENFGKRPWLRAMCYLGRCVFVEREGSRQSKNKTLEQIKFLLSLGQVVCLFPEGGRSRSGKIEPDLASYGVGQIVSETQNCRVLCVYLRGHQQSSYSFFPRRHDNFVVDVQMMQPASSSTGRRAYRDITRQIMIKLQGMEKKCLGCIAKLQQGKQQTNHSSLESDFG